MVKGMEYAFNIEKCNVMHVGYNNSDVEYAMEGVKLETVSEEIVRHFPIISK